jgi:integrase
VQGQTFSKIASELLIKKRKERKAPNTLAKLEWLYGLANVSLHDRPISEITAPEILLVLRKVEARGHLETAKRLRAVIGEVFRYAVATARASSDPTSALRGALTAPVVKHRAAITDPKELGGLLRAVDGFQGQPSTSAALKLMAYLFPRPGELRMAEWKEFDLAKAIWSIPASRAKMRKEHRIPLPRQTLAILSSLQPVTGHGKLVFPGYGISGGAGRKVEQRPISENTLNSALRRMGYDSDTMTSHGFRAAASTLLNESGKFSADAIERALAHQDPDAVRRAYARGEHWEERVTMMTWWADYLDALRDGAKVLAFDKRA